MLFLFSAVVTTCCARFFWVILETQIFRFEEESADVFVTVKSLFIALFVFLMLMPQIELEYRLIFFTLHFAAIWTVEKSSLTDL